MTTELREQGMAMLSTARMPTSRQEQWRFTDLAPLVTVGPSLISTMLSLATSQMPF